MTDWVADGTFVVELGGFLLLVESRLRQIRRANRRSQRLVMPDSPYPDKHGNLAWHIRWLFHAGTIGLILITVSLTAFFTELILTFPYANTSGTTMIPFSPNLAIGCIATEVAGLTLFRFAGSALTSKKRIHVLADVAAITGYELPDEEEDEPRKKKRKPETTFLKPVPSAIRRAGMRGRQ